VPFHHRIQTPFGVPPLEARRIQAVPMHQVRIFLHQQVTHEISLQRIQIQLQRLQLRHQILSLVEDPLEEIRTQTERDPRRRRQSVSGHHNRRPRYQTRSKN
jgi:hypothetical protein